MDRNNEKFTCCLEIQSKMAEIMSICTLNLLNYIKIKFIPDFNNPFWPSKSANAII